MSDVLPIGSRRLDPEDLGDHIDRLYRAAWAMCGNREDAEDLVQETYARVLSRPRWLRGDELGYLLRALRNTHINRMRTTSRRPRTTPMEEQAEPVAARTAWQPEAALEVGALFASIGALPPAYRDVVVAVDLVGLSYREAARALRVREATVTTRLHRGRLKLAGEATT